MAELIVNELDQDGKELSLSLNKRMFADVILNFLGKKEKLNFESQESFIIRLNDIEQFYYLINKKIEKEQNVFIEHFLVTLSYSDNTNREISGIKSLNNFLETRDVTARSVTLSWNIVVKYPNAETIENQTIELSFTKDKEEDECFISDTVILSINHTNQSWGIEVLNLLKDKISEASIKKHKAYQVALRIKEMMDSWILIMAGLYIFFMAFIYLPYNNEEINANYYKVIELWGSKDKDVEIQKALFSLRYMQPEFIEKTALNHIKNEELKKALINISKEKKDEKLKSIRYFLWKFIPFFIAFFSLKWYLSTVINYHEHKSYILINRRSEDEYDNELSKKSKIEFYSITFFIITMITGLFVNYMYDYLFN